MSETPSAERHSRAKAIYGLAVFLLVTAHGLVLFLSWLIKAVRPDWGCPTSAFRWKWA